MEWSNRIGRRLKLRDLHVFLAVVECRNMAKAADRLSISRPVVSKTITSLEHTLGVRLLDRSARGIEVTAYGQALRKWSVAAFDDLRQSVKEIEFLTDPTAGELRIGSTEAALTGPLPAVINRLSRDHPRLTFHVTLAVSGARLYLELRERNVDLIFGRLAMPAKEDDLNVETLFDEPMLVVAGTRNRWTRRRTIKLAELVDEPWVLPEADSAAGALIAETFHACDLDVPRATVTCNSVQMGLALAPSGPFLAMCPASAFQLSARRLPVTALPVTLPAMPRPVGITTLKARTISPVAELFIKCARSMLKPSAKAN